jgi:hypothetical protein
MGPLKASVDGTIEGLGLHGAWFRRPSDRGRSSDRRLPPTPPDGGVGGLWFRILVGVECERESNDITFRSVIDQ